MYKIAYIDLCDLEMTSVTLKSRSVSAIFELVGDLPKMHPYNTFGHSRSICSLVITLIVYRITYIDLFDLEMTSVTLKSRSMSAIFYLVQHLPKMHPYTKFGHPS